jgi:transposase-like protein
MEGIMKKIDLQVKLQANILFEKGVPLAEISTRLGININTLKNWAYKKRGSQIPWSVQELENSTSTAEEVVQLSIEEAKAKSLEILIRSINVMHAESASINLSDMQKLVKIIDVLDEYSKNEHEPIECEDSVEELDSDTLLDFFKEDLDE